MVEALTGADPRTPLPWLNVRVANQDWPLSDHTTYWGNREEVMARIVHAVGYSRLRKEALDVVRGTHDPRSAIDTTAASVVEHEGARHRRSVTYERATRLGPGLALFVLLIVFRARVRDLGGAIVSGLGFSWPAQGVLHRIAEATGWVKKHFAEGFLRPETEHGLVLGLARLEHVKPEGSAGGRPSEVIRLHPLLRGRRG